MPGRSPSRVEALLDELERGEPVSSSLGTPEILDSDAARALVAMGSSAVPSLVAELESGGPSRRAAHAAHVLGRIGDRRALAALGDLEARQRARQPKDEWDYAAIGEARLAIERIEGGGRA